MKQELANNIFDPLANKFGISKAISARNRIDFSQAKEICSEDFFDNFIQKEAEEEYFERIIGTRIKHSKIKIYLEAYKKLKGYGWSAMGKTRRYHNTEKGSLQILIPKYEILYLWAITLTIASLHVSLFLFMPQLPTGYKDLSLWFSITLLFIWFIFAFISLLMCINLFLGYWFAKGMKKELNH